jgi:hypothetical protein
MNAAHLSMRRAAGLILALAFGSASALPAQDVPPGASRSLITAATPAPAGKAAAMLTKLAMRPTVRRARTVTLDRSAFDGNRISLALFPDAEVTADKMDIGFTGVRSRTWTGRLAGGGSAAFVINGDRISGTVSSTNGNFEFFPGDNGECVVVQHLPNGYPDCAVGKVTPPAPRSSINATNKPSNGDQAATGWNGGDPTNGDTPTGNRVRVLVAYTADAQSLTSSQLGRTMQEHIDLAVLESNQGYANSSVTMRMELACLYETVFAETGAIENDVADFRDPSDGKSDEVHALRADYDADMCCLLIDGTDPDWCGWAYGFDYTAYDNMFQATVYSCATGQFTFAHEFGHTQGCRHNDDNNLTPFAYGHGFRNGGNWRTIMGLANGTDAVRLNYWSNPNINSPVAPFTAMGTPIDGGNFANDDHAALNAGDATVVNHEATPASSVALTGDVFNNDEAADKVVTGTLTVGSFTANSGSRVQFRAGTGITLTPGFWARPGSSFRARLAGPLGDPAPVGDPPSDPSQ